MLAAEVPGLLVVGGGTADGTGPSRLWIAGITSDGCWSWADTEGSGAYFSESLVLGVAGSPQVGYYAVGTVGEPDDGEAESFRDVWLRRYAPDGDIAWTRRERADADHVASGVAVAPDGGAIVVGGSDWRGWLQRYSIDGDPVGATTWLGDGPISHMLDVVVTPAGRAWVSMWIEDGSDTRAWIGGLDDRDQLAWLSPGVGASGDNARLALSRDLSPVLVEFGAVSGWSPQGELAWRGAIDGVQQLTIRRAAVTHDGSIVAVGGAGSEQEPVLLILSADGTLLGVQRVPGLEFGSASDISVGADGGDGGIYLTGLIRYDRYAPPCDTWVAKAHLEAR